MDIYVNNNDELVLLNDKSIANDLTSDISTSHGIPTIPAQKLFKATYDKLSAADNAISSNLDDLSGKYESTKTNVETSCDAISNLIGNISTDISNAITSDVKNLGDLQLSTSYISSEVNRLCAELSADVISAVDANMRTVKTFNKHIEFNNKNITEYDSLSALFNEFNIKDDYNAIKNGTIVDVHFSNDVPISGYIKVTDRENAISICHNDWLLIQDDNRVSRIQLKDLNAGNVKVLNAGVSYHDFSLERQDRIATDSYISAQVDISANALCAEISSLSDQVSSISNYLSSEISTKTAVWVQDLDDKGDPTLSNVSELSIIKITKDEFDDNIASNTLTMSSNVLYVVSSDYLDAYGQTLKNLTMTDDAIASEATNKHYVDAKDDKIANDIDEVINKVNAINNNIDIINDNIDVIDGAFEEDTMVDNPVFRKLLEDNNNTDISAVISAVIYIFSSLSNVYRY